MGSRNGEDHDLVGSYNYKRVNGIKGGTSNVKMDKKQPNGQPGDM